MPLILRWLYLNFRYRVWPLPNNPAKLEKLAKDLQIPLAFTYRAQGIDSALAQQRIRERLNSFRWSAPLVIAVLCFSLLVGTLFHLVFLLSGKRPRPIVDRNTELHSHLCRERLNLELALYEFPAIIEISDREN